MDFAFKVTAASIYLKKERLVAKITILHFAGERVGIYSLC